ncbi:Glyoxylase B2 [Diplonema papillatum]|nr:Glyoxylase B2 [Diplonema papillatum]|eukprot:gene11003-16920_t
MTPPEVKAFFHHQSHTLSYVVHDPDTKKGVVIDAAMDFEAVAGLLGSTTTSSLHELMAYVKEKDLKIEWILETHAHADHISGAPYLRDQLNAKIAHSKGITWVQETFKDFFNLEEGFKTDGSQFDRLLSEGDELSVGGMTVRVLATPGHTNDSVSYIIGKNVFVGDTLFMPDGGTARCDFPGGSAEKLYESIQKIYNLGPDMTVWVCHDYQPQGRELKYETTVKEQMDSNIQLRGETGKDEYTATRRKRDAGLSLPKLIYPSIQLNIRAGHLPPKESNGKTYLKMPISFNHS